MWAKCRGMVSFLKSDGEQYRLKPRENPWLQPSTMFMQTFFKLRAVFLFLEKFWGRTQHRQPPLALLSRRSLVSRALFPLTSARSSRFRPLMKGNEDLGTRLIPPLTLVALQFCPAWQTCLTRSDQLYVLLFLPMKLRCDRVPWDYFT